MITDQEVILEKVPFDESTRKGERPQNHDRVCNSFWGLGENTDGWVMTVADGGGSNPNAGLAAERASYAAMEYLSLTGGSKVLREGDIETAFIKASYEVEKLAEGLPNKYYGPFTTLSVVTYDKKREEFLFGNVGDTRSYLISAEGELLFASGMWQGAFGLAGALGGGPSDPPEITTCKVGESEPVDGVIALCATDGVWRPLSYFDEEGNGDLICFDYRFARLVHSLNIRAQGDARDLAGMITNVALQGRPELAGDNATVAVTVL